jgi:uncharacterized OsmC-like protein
MDAEGLKEVQAPLKQRYRDDPDAALITLEADGSLDEGIACSVKTNQAIVQAGLHPGTGGDPALACSGDMLLQALVACAGVTMRAVASIRLRFDLDSEASDEELATLMKLTERYCVVFQTLAGSPSLEVSRG